MNGICNWLANKRLVEGIRGQLRQLEEHDPAQQDHLDVELGLY